ncbi:hypothetical protein ACVWW4_003789 [Bradyrhizobium sp. LB7.1]
MPPSIAVSSLRSVGSIRPDNVHSCFASLSEAGTNPTTTQKSGARFTEKQGYYLAFIHTYAHMFGRPPAEADIQRHFRVSPPSVDQIIVTLERNPTSTWRPQKHRNPRAAGKLPILEWLTVMNH